MIQPQCELDMAQTAEAMLKAALTLSAFAGNTVTSNEATTYLPHVENTAHIISRDEHIQLKQICWGEEKN